MLFFPSRFSDNFHKFDEVIHVTESVSTFIVLKRVTEESYFELLGFLVFMTAFCVPKCYPMNSTLSFSNRGC